MTRSSAASRLAALALVVGLVRPLAADAKASLRIAASEIGFYAVSLSIVARGAVVVEAPEGSGSADAAYVDLRHNRLVLAGNARLGAYAGDAIAVDLDDHAVATLRVEDGATSGDFGFPTSIRATSTSARTMPRRPHANALRAGSVPGLDRRVTGDYLYTFADGSGFSAQSLPGASFDQPYGITGTPSSLIAAHFRYAQGTGAGIAIDHHLVDADRSYLVTSIDTPLGTGRQFGINGYRRLGARYTTSVDGTVARGFFVLHATQTAAFGLAGARLEASAFSGGGGNVELALRSPDRPLFLGLTYRLARSAVSICARWRAPAARRSVHYQTLWHHGADLRRGPVWRGPFGTSVSATLERRTARSAAARFVQ